MEILQLILNAFVIIIFFYFLFFKSYYIQKGKNLATKEDIGKITEIIEKIKIEINKELELFKIKETRIQTYKTEIFSDFINLFLEIEQKNKTNKKFDSIFENKLKKLKYFIYLYASDETILKFKEIIEISKKEVDNITAVKILGNFILSMRKDIGNINTKLNEDALLSLFITDWENLKQKNL